MSDKKSKTKKNNDIKDKGKEDNVIEKSENQSLKEQAIDESATHGERINHQVKDKKNHHQPRDTA